MSDLEKVKKDGLSLEEIKNQTEAICLAAVKQNGHALNYVQHQTEAICIAAVEEDYNALHYVQPNYFETTIRTLRLRALFDSELEDYIKDMERMSLI